MNNRKKRLKAAAKLPAYMRDFAARKGGKPKIRGTFGPAGPVKIIKPGEGA